MNLFPKIETFDGEMTLRTVEFISGEGEPVHHFFGTWVNYAELIAKFSDVKKRIAKPDNYCPENLLLTGVIYHEDTIPEGLNGDTLYLYPPGVLQFNNVCQTHCGQTVVITVHERLICNYVASIPLAYVKSLMETKL